MHVPSCNTGHLIRNREADAVLHFLFERESAFYSNLRERRSDYLLSSIDASLAFLLASFLLGILYGIGRPVLLGASRKILPKLYCIDNCIGGGVIQGVKTPVFFR